MSTSVLRKWLKVMGQKSAPATVAETIVQSPESSSNVSTSAGSESSQPRQYLSHSVEDRLPETQHRLLIHAPKESFKLERDAELPALKSSDEIVLRVDSIGLNPIDWKSPAFGYGLPSLPCVLGRDYVGTVVKIPEEHDQNSSLPRRSLRLGDAVIVVSTDYRDNRRAAFQQYSVALRSNIGRIPAATPHASTLLPAIGVAYVTAAISLGVCLGLDFKSIAGIPGPDLYSIVRTLRRDSLAEDIRVEVFDSLPEQDRIRPGDWLVVWGASSTVGFLTVQLAKKAGLKTVAVADLTNNASKLVDIGADVLVHRSDPNETVKIITSLTAGKNLRYGIDAVGKETASQLQSTFRPASSEQKPHLVCLVGSPKESPEGAAETVYHKLPMKLFHESPAVGQGLMEWLEDLLATDGGLVMPNVEVHHSRGLEHLNEALERLRDGKIDGHRLVLEI